MFEDKVVLLELSGGELIVYEDGTYRCKHWRVDDISEWKIIDGLWFHKHMGETEFKVQESDIQGARAIATAVQRRIDLLFEKEVWNE